MQSSADLLRLTTDSCEDAHALCVPEAQLDAGYRPGECRALGDREGRCWSSCLPEVAQQASRLARAECAEGELCVPCFDPLSGDATGACDRDGDHPREPARPLAECCDAAAGPLGRCVSIAALAATVPATDLERLAADRCTGSEELCIPEAWLESGDSKAAACRAPGDLEGRCMPACLPDIAKLAAQLRPMSCAQGELCAPCFDPRSGADTQACRLGDDRPREPAKGFEDCCALGGRAFGACVPSALLSDAQLEAAPLDTCHTYDARCVPLALAGGEGGALTRCPSVPATGTLDGVCLAECFIGSALAPLLSRGGCASNERCVPCARVPAAAGGCG
jgi:hypothetical protein